MYMSSGKIRVRCISGSGKIRMGISVLLVLGWPNRSWASFLWVIYLSSNLKSFVYLYLKLSVFDKKNYNRSFLKEYWKYSNVLLWNMNVMYRWAKSWVRFGLGGPYIKIGLIMGWVIYGSGRLNHVNGSEWFDMLITLLISRYFR